MTGWSFWTWFVFEGEPEKELFKYTDSDDYIFYGMVHGFENALSYFRLSELEGVRCPGGLTIERDRCIFQVRYGDYNHSRYEDMS